MGEFQNIAFESNNQLLDLLVFWKRFIDDVLGLFRGNEKEFEELVDWLNSIMRGVVKFKSNFSSDQVEFLDLIISIEKGKLKTNFFIMHQIYKSIWILCQTTQPTVKLGWFMDRP